MLRKTLIATFLLSASGSALALDDFLSRHRIEPHVSITLSTGHHNDVYRETRHREVYYRDVYRDVYVPRPVYVQPVYYNYYRQDEGRHYGRHKNKHHKGWREYDRYDHHDRSRHHRYGHDD